MRGFIFLLILFFAGCSNRHLLVHYPFNGNANDNGKNHLHGNVHGATLTTDRNNKSSAAYSFDGKAYIEVDDTTILRFTNNFTIAAWIYPTEFKRMGSRIVDKSVGSKGTGFVLDTYGHDQQGRTIRLQCGEGWKYMSGTHLQENQWYFICVTYQNGVGKIYINGMLDNVGISQVKKEIAPATTPLRFGFDTGVRTGVDFDDSFVGKLDDIRLYSIALKRGAVKRLYKQAE